MTRSMLLVLGTCWAEINGGMLVGATTGRTSMGSREKASCLELAGILVGRIF